MFPGNLRSGWLLWHSRAMPEEKIAMKRCFAPLHDQSVAGLFGGGEDGQSMAVLLHRLKFDLPLDDLTGQTGPQKFKPVTAQPNPTGPLRVKPGKTR